MKEIVVISKGMETSKNIAKQLKDIIGDNVRVENHCIDVGFKENFAGKLVLITNRLIKDYLTSKLHLSARIIVARRAIDYHSLDKLISIPAGSEVLLINDVEGTCMETISQLKDIGIDHVKYNPFYLGKESYPELELGVTVGEAHIAPSCVKRLIDIGTRFLDITTIFEVLMNLNMMEEKGGLISSRFVRSIVDLSKQYNKAANDSIELKNMFETIVENSSDGIAYCSRSGEVSAVNEVFLNYLSLERDNVINRNIDEMLPVIKGLNLNDKESDIFKISARDFVITRCPVKRENSIAGYMITMKDITEIQEIEYELRRKMRKQEHNAIYRFNDIIGNSLSIRKKVELAKKLSVSDSTILIQGESGTGKEYYAQAIHNYSKRKNGPFVPVNFAALSANLLESELFGYEEGAFTGAKKGGKSGLFEEAHGGTIFLDEIGDASYEMQVCLLRVLQEKEVRHVGGNKRIPIDVRVIAATNKDLKKLVEEGKFRLDLFYRINVLTLDIPPLRNRKEDIMQLMETYLKKLSHNRHVNVSEFFSDDAIAFLQAYKWEGNVRELVNVVEYLIHIKDRNPIGTEDLPAYILRNCCDKTGHSLSRFGEENISWILKKLWENNSLGRRALALLAKNEKKDLSEARIRDILKSMEDDGYIVVGKGMRGTKISKKGTELMGG